MSTIGYEHAVELAAQMDKRYQETEERLKSLLSEKRTAGIKSRNEARMQEEIAVNKADARKRKQGAAAAEKRIQEEAAAAEKRRREEAAAAEKRRQEEAAAAEKRRQEEKEAEERRRRKLALYRGLYNVVTFSILLTICVAGLYIFWIKDLLPSLSKNADKLYIGPISHSLLLISLSYYLFKRRFFTYRLVEFLIIIGLMTAIYYPLTTRYATEYYYQFFLGGMSFAVPGVLIACYRGLRSERSFRYLWWIIASIIILPILSFIVFLILRFLLWIAFGIASIFISGANSDWFLLDYTMIPLMWIIGLLLAAGIMPED
ncbi:MAG: hypothetical protein MSQ05_01175 [Akkermansia sp.]|nr:hypothetical protein [Akkermansia sp.]